MGNASVLRIMINSCLMLNKSILQQQLDIVMETHNGGPK